MNLRLDQLKEGGRVDSQRTRSSPRIRLQVPVFLRASDASGTEFIELTRTLNISATGACITSTHLLRPEQTVLLTIPAPSPTSSSLIPSETPPIQAKVRRLETLGDQRLFGLEFLRPLD
jgi:PilZ domain